MFVVEFFGEDFCDFDLYVCGVGDMQFVMYVGDVCGFCFEMEVFDVEWCVFCQVEL